ncbi:uncharacterized protein Dmul_28190 [Desulfococcus multivorans]|nr:uncharacterized protein Dmul_28190 [Desulfococcus multivorans]
MKMGNPGKGVWLVAVTTDNAAAVSENTDDAAVFPVGRSVFEREFEDTKEVFNNIAWDLEFDILFVLGPFFSLCL